MGGIQRHTVNSSRVARPLAAVVSCNRPFFQHLFCDIFQLLHLFFRAFVHCQFESMAVWIKEDVRLLIGVLPPS